MASNANMYIFALLRAWVTDFHSPAAARWGNPKPRQKSLLWILVKPAFQRSAAPPLGGFFVGAVNKYL
jgi:hypothetical protein